MANKKRAVTYGTETVNAGRSKKMELVGAYAVFMSAEPPGRRAIKSRLVELVSSGRFRPSSSTRLNELIDDDPQHPALAQAVVDAWWANPAGDSKRTSDRASAGKIASVMERRLGSPLGPVLRREREPDAMDAAFAYALGSYVAANNAIPFPTPAMEELAAFASSNGTTGVPNTQTSRRPLRGIATSWKSPVGALAALFLDLGNDRQSPYFRSIFPRYESSEEIDRSIAHWIATVIPSPFQTLYGAGASVVRNVDSFKPEKISDLQDWYMNTGKAQVRPL